MLLQKIIDATRAKGSQSPWKGFCPNHENKTACLGIGLAKDGHIWLKCHRGCTTDAVCSGLGISKSDLFPHDDPQYIHDTFHDYRDETGKLIFQTVRLRLADPTKWPNAKKKKMYQRRPDGEGGFVNNLNGVRRVLYQLPTLVDPQKQGATVFKVEGEKCVDRLIDLGLVATCNPLGAGTKVNNYNWLESYSEFLRGREIVILPDNDEEGRAHAMGVAASLFGIASKIQILELWKIWTEMPPKGDVYDWIEIGHTADELCNLCEDLPVWSPVNPSTNGHAPGTLSIPMSSVEVEPVEWLWERRIPMKLMTILQGIEGVGKSILLTAIAAAITTGRGLPDMNISNPGNVLWLSAEDDLGMMLKPRLLAAGADCAKVFAISEIFTLDDNGIELLRRECVVRNPLLVILDPLFAYTVGDPNKGADARTITNDLKRIVEEFRCAMVLVRHVGKAKGFGDPRAAGMYSIEWQAAARSVLLAGCDPDNPKKRALTQIKNNLSEMADSIEYSIQTDPSSPSKARFYWGGISDLTARRILETIANDEESLMRSDAEEFLKIILAGGELPAKDVQSEARANGISERTLDRAKSRLRVKSRKLTNKGPWLWSLGATTLEILEERQFSENGALHESIDSIEDMGEK